LALNGEANGLPKYRFPSDPESAQELREVEVLTLRATKLLKEIASVRERLYWLQNCPLEVMLRIDDLKERIGEFHEICYRHHLSLLKGKSVPDTDISDLQKGYERLKEAWSEFLITTGLGILWI
jgi:hypothetical protein